MTHVSETATPLVATWRVWVGTYTDPVTIVTPPESDLAQVAQTGKVAMLHKMQGNVRPEHEEYDSQFWLDQVAKCEVTKVERAGNVYLDPRLAGRAALDASHD